MILPSRTKGSWLTDIWRFSFCVVVENSLFQNPIDLISRSDLPWDSGSERWFSSAYLASASCASCLEAFDQGPGPFCINLCTWVLAAYGGPIMEILGL